jgi:putative PIN family toxin of toxin-antitoxin system
MRVMLDSNILISTVVFMSPQMDSFVEKLKKHTIVLTNIIIEECIEVVRRKFPLKQNAFKAFLSELTYDYSVIVDNIVYDYDIRDEFDKKILHSAYVCSVDVLVTGDKDFFEKEYKGLEILTVSNFLKKY